MLKGALFILFFNLSLHAMRLTFLPLAKKAYLLESLKMSTLKQQLYIMQKPMVVLKENLRLQSIKTIVEKNPHFYIDTMRYNFGAHNFDATNISFLGVGLLSHNQDIITYLLSKRPDMENVMQLRTKKSVTALELANAMGNTEVINLLGAYIQERKLWIQQKIREK